MTENLIIQSGDIEIILGVFMDLKSDLLSSLESEDDLGVVIRSHIVIEQYLNKLICLRIVNSSHLERMDIDYFSTVQLALALGLGSRFENPLTALGTIRNGFAHTLRPEIGKQDANNLYASLSGSEKQTVQSGVRAAHEELKVGVKKHKDFDARQQFISVVLVLAAALQKACREAANK